MKKKEFFLRTIFCCMACDGEIAAEEIDLVKDYVSKTNEFDGLDVQQLIDQYIEEINETGVLFLNRFLSKVAELELTEEDQLHLLDLAIEMIEADNKILYSEVKFFKKIRFRLPVSDDQILERHPDKEDFLLPDLEIAKDPVWNEVQFEKISFECILKDLEESAPEE